MPDAVLWLLLAVLPALLALKQICPCNTQGMSDASRIHAPQRAVQRLVHTATSAHAPMHRHHGAIVHISAVTNGAADVGTAFRCLQARAVQYYNVNSARPGSHPKQLHSHDSGAHCSAVHCRHAGVPGTCPHAPAAASRGVRKVAPRIPKSATAGRGRWC